VHKVHDTHEAHNLTKVQKVKVKMSITPIRYYQYFQQAKLQKYESTQEVVDSLFRYEALLIYRMSVVRTNDNYWFLCNSLDDVFGNHQLYKKILHTGKMLDATYLLRIVNEFESALYNEYGSKVDRKSTHIVRDTISMIKVWKTALSKL
jgi:hypothetical protein